MSAILRKYATATTVYFPLIGAGTVNFTSTASLTTADTKISINGGAFATVGTAVVNEGSYGYSYACTTADLTGKYIVLVNSHTAGSKTFEDSMILIETYGHADAAHIFDFSIANQTVIASAGTVTLTGGQLVTVGTISAAAVGAGLLSAGAFAAGFLSAGGIAASAISVGGIATGAIDSTKFASGAIDSVAIATGAFTTDAFVAGFLSAGGVAAGALSAGAFAAGFLSAGGIAAAAISAGGIAAGAISAGGIAAGAISAGGIATGAIDADALATDAVAEIWGIAAVPSTAAPAWTASMLSTISWMFALSKNTITQTSVLQVVMQSDGATTLAESTVSDDATTFTRGSFN